MNLSWLMYKIVQKNMLKTFKFLKISLNSKKKNISQ